VATLPSPWPPLIALGSTPENINLCRALYWFSAPAPSFQVGLNRPGLPAVSGFRSGQLPEGCRPSSPAVGLAFRV
jgi:hypothetical protein